MSGVQHYEAAAGAGGEAGGAAQPLPEVTSWGRKSQALVSPFILIL